MSAFPFISEDIKSTASYANASVREHSRSRSPDRVDRDTDHDSRYGRDDRDTNRRHNDSRFGRDDRDTDRRQNDSRYGREDRDTDRRQNDSRYDRGGIGEYQDRDRGRGREKDNDFDRRRDHRDTREDFVDRGRESRQVSETGVIQPIDANLAPIPDDPRVINGKKIAKTKGGGRNTESFDPRSTLVRPEMRVIVGPNNSTYGKKIKHDDVIIVPNFLCPEEDWSLYYKLIEEVRESQSKDEVKGSEWISWAEGAHLITKNPDGSKTYAEIQEKIAAYFEIERKSVGTRFNWYRDSTDWKPFHHDSAAFNAQRARNQNITVGISLGASRELAFLHANSGDKIYFPQPNATLFAFGRDVNIRYKHAINALAPEEQDGKGRISIILWGKVNNVIEERNSPHMLDDNTRGGGHSIHANRSSGTGSGSLYSGASTSTGQLNRNDKNEKGDHCRDFKKGMCSRGESCRFSHQG